jgi:hypothetical protein
LIKVFCVTFGVQCNHRQLFTSCVLAQKLLAKRTSIFGTVRQNRRELPPHSAMTLYDSIFYENGSLNLVRYLAKPNKCVNLLSTQHRGVSLEADRKKKPASILYYNKNKCGVDMLDSMCRQLSTKAGCRRWPGAVFYNILDLSGINAGIVYRKAIGSRISRRRFLLSLSRELINDDNGSAFGSANSMPQPAELQNSRPELPAR